MPTNSKEYMNKYYHAHKDKILSNMSTKIVCNRCGCEIQKCHMNRHQLTKKCKKSLKE